MDNNKNDTKIVGRFGNKGVAGSIEPEKITPVFEGSENVKIINDIRVLENAYHASRVLGFNILLKLLKQIDDNKYPVETEVIEFSEAAIKLYSDISGANETEMKDFSEFLRKNQGKHAILEDPKYPNLLEGLVESTLNAHGEKDEYAIKILTDAGYNIEFDKVSTLETKKGLILF